MVIEEQAQGTLPRDGSTEIVQTVTPRRNRRKRQEVFRRSIGLGVALLSCPGMCLPASRAGAQSSRSDACHSVTEMADSSSPPAPTPERLPGSNAEATPEDLQSTKDRQQGMAHTAQTGHFDHLIDPQEIAPRLSAGDKVGMGIKASVSPFAVIGWVGSATYSETLNRSPNYGQSAESYPQRLGAAAARASSEDIFSTTVMAPILHEDPRYFVEGPGSSVFHRVFYALSRVLVTKTDAGRSTINYALLSGNAIGAGLTQTYYPAGNRNLHGTATTFGISLASSGVKFLLEEFFYREASIAELKRKL